MNLEAAPWSLWKTKYIQHQRTLLSPSEGDAIQSSVGRRANVSSVGCRTDVSSVGRRTDVSSVGCRTDVSSVGRHTNVSSVGLRTNVSSVGLRTDVSSVGRALTSSVNCHMKIYARAAVINATRLFYDKMNSSNEL